MFISYLLSVIGYQLSVIGYQLSVIVTVTSNQYQLVKMQVL